MARVGPDSFVDTIAPYGPADHHFLRDLATFQAGVGIALLAAVGRPSWRVPVLFAALARTRCTPSTTCSTSVGPTRAGWGRSTSSRLLLLTGAYAYLMQEAARERRPVRVFLAGATGVIGRRLLPMLVAAGHEVTAMTRSEERAAALRDAGATPVVCDVFDAEGVRAAMEARGPEVVLHELTDLPPALDPRKMEEQAAGNDRIRTEGTRNLVAAAVAAGARASSRRASRSRTRRRARA